MKYISLLIFTAALAWTWHLVHSSSSISFETHSGIQEKLAALIVETVKAKRPTASNIVIDKIWTEVLEPGKVKAYFVYSFKDNSESGPVSSQIKGDLMLERQGDDGSGNDRWAVMGRPQVSGDSIIFDDATIVTGSPTGSSEATSGETATTPEHSSDQPATTEPKAEETH